MTGEGRFISPVAARLRLFGRTTRRVRNWPTVTGRYLRARQGMATPDLEMRFRDGVIVSAPAAPLECWPVFEVLVNDCYRIAELPRLLSCTPQAILDIGAHVGASALALRRAFPESRLACYEPSAVTAAYLRRNLALNDIDATVAESAVGGHDGYGILEGDGSASCEAFLVQTDETAEGAITVVGFDAAMAALDGEGPTIVKLDCEGSEYAILDESRPATWSSVVAVLIEYHPMQTRRGFDEVSERLRGFGLHALWHEPDGGRPDLGTACFAREGGVARR